MLGIRICRYVDVYLHGRELVLVLPVHHGDGVNVQLLLLKVALVEELVTDQGRDLLLRLPWLCDGT